jgi:hypothetical protein
LSEILWELRFQRDGYYLVRNNIPIVSALKKRKNSGAPRRCNEIGEEILAAGGRDNNDPSTAISENEKFNTDYGFFYIEN